MNSRNAKSQHDGADEVIDAVRSAFNEGEHAEFEGRAEEQIARFRRDLTGHPYVAAGKPRLIGGAAGAVRRFFRPALITGIGVACMALAAALLLGNSTPTWAEVLESFRSVRSFSAAVYIKESPVTEPREFDLWMGRGGRARMLAGGQVIFAREGKVSKAFDLTARKETEADRHAVGLLESLGATSDFSLDTVLRSFSGEMTEVTPIVNGDAIVSKDIVVFDVRSSEMPAWMRIWALKSSRLPVRIQVVETLTGGSSDVVLAYSKDQPDAFYDADAFKRQLADTSRNASQLAYSLFEDAAGRKVVEKPLSESDALGIVTTTLDGAPWSLSQHRGKAVLMAFWTDEIDKGWRDWLKGLQERFGKHDDLEIVCVALDADAAAVKAYCKENSIEWLQLHEPGKNWQNSLARAFRLPRFVGPYTDMWLVCKDGSVANPHGTQEMTGRLEAELLGITYESAPWIWQKLNRVRSTKSLFTEDTARTLYGEPDSMRREGSRNVWNYRRMNAEGTRVKNLGLEFDDKRDLAGYRESNAIIDAAKLSVTISEAFWNGSVRNAVKPYVAAPDQYAMELIARDGKVGHSIAYGAMTAGVIPGKAYTERLIPGTYDICLAARDKKTYQHVWETILAKGVTLGKDETRALTVE